MEFFMGQELRQPELPAGSSRPSYTPSEGVIVVDNDPDGYTRRYLYKAIGGNPSEVLISKEPTSRGQKAPMLGRPTPMPQLDKPVGPRMGETMQISGQRPDVIQKKAPVPVDDSVMRQQKPVQMKSSMGGPTSFLDNAVKVVGLGNPALGQVPRKQVSPGSPNGVFPTASRTMGQAAPAAAPVVPATCPGAVEMPDGRKIDPDDLIKLADLCELMPFLLESYSSMQQAKATGQLAPGQSVPIAGQQPTAGGMVPSVSQFGPAGGVTGGGGAMFGGGGGPGPAGPQGIQGPPGVAGIPGLGGIVDSLRKVDGDFIAGPGAFIAVPGTLITFSQSQLGPATFLLNAAVGTTSGVSGLSQSGQMGLRIDGVDYPLVSRLLNAEPTVMEGSYPFAEFILNQPIVFSLPLAAGSHTVEVILRGLAPAEFGGASLAISFGVSAVPTQPLDLSVVHN